MHQADLVAAAPVYGKIQEAVKGMQAAIARSLKTKMVRSRELSYRFSVFQYKIERALKFASVHAYNISWWYARSAVHDMGAVNAFIGEAGHSSMVMLSSCSGTASRVKWSSR